MSVGKQEEEKLRAKEFENLLDEEIAYVENLMKPPTIEIRMKNMAMMTRKEAIETGMALIKKAGVLLLRFNSLTENYKIGLFDKLMEYIDKLKNLLEEFGKKIGVESFSIEVGWPWGVSISVTFKPK